MPAPGAKQAPPKSGNSLRATLVRSHLAVAGAGLALLAVALVSTLWLSSQTLELTQVRTPIFEALSQVQTGNERAMGALLGWVVAGERRNFGRRGGELGTTRLIQPPKNSRPCDSTCHAEGRRLSANCSILWRIWPSRNGGWRTLPKPRGTHRSASWWRSRSFRRRKCFSKRLPP